MSIYIDILNIQQKRMMKELDRQLKKTINNTLEGAVYNKLAGEEVFVFVRNKLRKAIVLYGDGKQSLIEYEIKDKTFLRFYMQDGNRSISYRKLSDSILFKIKSWKGKPNGEYLGTPKEYFSKRKCRITAEKS